MNTEKIDSALDAIAAEAPAEDARVLIRHMVGGGSITHIKATRSGLLRLGSELIRAGTKTDPNSDAFRPLLGQKPDDDVFIEIKDRPEDVRPNPKVVRELSLFVVWQFVWTGLLLGFAAIGVISAGYFIFFR